MNFVPWNVAKETKEKTPRTRQQEDLEYALVYSLYIGMGLMLAMMGAVYGLLPHSGFLSGAEIDRISFGAGIVFSGVGLIISIGSFFALRKPVKRLREDAKKEKE